MAPPPAPKISTHIHSGLLLSTYFLLFPSLVSDPPTALWTTLPALAVVQTVYCLFSLPSTPPPAATPIQAPPPSDTSTYSPAPSKRAPRLYYHKRAAAPAGINLTSTLLSLSLAATLGTLILYAVVVVFGAPLTTHAAHTVGMAAHMALLAGFPLVQRYGVDPDRWSALLGMRGGVEEAYLGAVGTGIGAWLGAIPIPLDWDREWQKWPVTVVTGAYIGYVLGKSLGQVFAGRRLPF